MGSKSVLTVGLGEVGSAIYEIIVESGRYEAFGYDKDPSRTVNKPDEILVPIDYLHVCIPYTSQDNFIGAVEEYVKRYRPSLIIVHSTVAPGTTRRLTEKLEAPVAYSPVRGKHPRLKEHILFWPKWVAALSVRALDEVACHLRDIGLKVKVYEGSPETLELAKLFETVYRALIIAWWQETHRIARRFNADIVTIAEFVAEVNSVLGDRPILYPGVIGGHCLIPNTKILRSVCESKFLDAILESNKRREEEINDLEIKKEVEKLREIAYRYINRQYFKNVKP